jgi:hypothetical protein
MNTAPTPLQDDDLLLAPSWLLTTHHARSNCGKPLLVHRPTGDAYGPDDLVEFGIEIMPARMLVARFANLLALAEQRHVAMRFCQQDRQ